MKRFFLGVTWLVLLILIAGCSGAAVTPAPKPTEPAVKASSSIIAEGKVVPVRSAALSLPIAGTAAEVLVKEGDRVEANQVLVRVNATQQKAAIDTAQAALARAQAHYDELKAGPRQPEIDAAQAAVDAAQAALQKLQQGPDKNQIIAAQADLQNALASLKQAQAAYDQAGGASNPYVGLLPTSLALEQATNNYNAAKARLAAAQEGPKAGDIAAAQAEIRRAQAQLDLLKAGTKPETLATAQADITSAKAELARVQATLADTELRAPFAGVVASLDTHVGEQVAPSTAIIQLADFSGWQIETTDLTELNVARVGVGDSAELTFDAIDGLSLGGKVSRIKTVGENKQGDIVYTVVIQPDKMDERLRWNMTAKVNLAPK